MAKSTKAPTFEAQLAELEAMVERMEAGDLPLEELLSCYQDGVKLSREMQARLVQAEGRLTELQAEPASGSDKASKPADEAPRAEQTSLLDE